jgi:hypothetical protein
MTETTRSSHRARSWTLLLGGVVVAIAGAVFLGIGTERELRAWTLVVGGVVLALVGVYRFIRPDTRLGDGMAHRDAGRAGGLR